MTAKGIVGTRNDIRRLAVVNRGKAAVSLIHGVRDYIDADGTDIRRIALDTDADERLMLTRAADVAFPSGGRS